jgi:hypothetical protein
VRVVNRKLMAQFMAQFVPDVIFFSLYLQISYCIAYHRHNRLGEENIVLTRLAWVGTRLSHTSRMTHSRAL